MARIRSIHPGIWTDEAFAMLSHASRVLLFGIWTEADDHGVFEWKPVMLKMRILPADAVNITELLGELIDFKQVKKVTIGSTEYGLVRNFCRWQRPKKPNYRFVLPDEYRTYVGLKANSSEPVPHQYTTSTELSNQMEDVEKEEGGEEEESTKLKEPYNVNPGHRRRKAPYVFEAGIIRLNQVDFDRWKRAFPNLNLEGELTGLAEWAGQPAQREKWFAAVSGALAKRDRTNMLAKQSQSRSQAPPERYEDPRL